MKNDANSQWKNSDRGSSGTISSTLLQRVRQMDADAWMRMVDLFGPLVFSWCRLCGLQPADSENIVQETFQGVLSGIHRFQRSSGEGSFRGWLRKIAKSKISDLLRRRRREAEPAGDLDSKEVVDRLGDDSASVDLEIERRQVIWRAIDLIRCDFEEATWRAFWETTVEGRTAAEVGRQLGLRENNVRQAKFRVLRRLRTDLEGVWP
jgi:RNA polymerase sigma-70 factor (ECF subfamily)